MPWIASQCRGSIKGHFFWLATAASLGFLVSFVSVSLGSLPRNGFVLLHALIIGAFFLFYTRRDGPRISDLGANWPLGLLLGSGAAAFSVSFVLSEPASPGLEGLDYILSVAWLGFIYGMVDAFLLSALPVFSVYCIADRLGWLSCWTGWAATGMLALLASLLMTTAYHLGPPEFQGPGILGPVIGNTVFTLAYILSGSPLAPILSHIGMHVVSVTHAYHTSISLPPH